MKLLSFSSILIGALLAGSANAESIELRPDNVKEITSSGTWLIEHFSPYCRHCQNFAPEWKRLSDDLDYLAKESDFHFGTIDCSIHGDLCDAHEVKGYPTLQLWRNDEKIEHYRNGNTYEPLMEYIMKRVDGPTHVEITEQEPEESVEVMDQEVEEEEEEEVSSPIVLPNEQGVSVNLDGEQLKEISANRVPWFVKFYAPWCGHCKHLAPTWTEMASQLKGQVNVGEVNCEALPGVCQEYGVRGFPTLEMFGHGDPILFNSDRSLVSLVKFANENSGPAVKQVSGDELNQYLSVKEVAFVYLYNDQQGAPELIETLADQFASSLSFFSTNDESAFTKFNLVSSDLPTVLIAKDDDFQIFAMHDFTNNKANRQPLVNWIEMEQYPLVSKLTPNNLSKVLQSHLPAVFHLVDENDRVNQDKFKELAMTWQKSFSVKTGAIFVEMYRDMWKDYAQEKFGRSAPNSIIIYDGPNNMYYIQDLSNHVLSLEKPEGIYLALKNLNQLKGQSTLLLHEKISNTFVWLFRHWFISFICFGIIGSVVYRYFTFRSPKRLNSVLPSFKTNVNDYTHKD